MPRRPPSRLPRLLLRLASGLLALVLLALIAATFALPRWIRGPGAALASEALGRPVSIADASFQPWRLGLVLEGVRVEGAAPAAPPLLELQRFNAALSLRSLFHLQPVVASLELTAPVLRVSRTADGHYDVDDLLQRFSRPSPNADNRSPAALALYNLRLNQGQILFDDRPVRRQLALTELRVELPFLSTLAADVTVEVQPHVAGKLNGVAFRSEVQALPFATTRAARLSLKLDGLDLAPLAPYVPASSPVRLQSGRLDLDLGLDFAQPANQVPKLQLSGSVGLRDADLRLAQGEPLLAWRRLWVPLKDVQPLRRDVALGAIRWEAPQLALSRDRRGRLNLPSAGEPAGKDQPGAPWRLKLDGFELEAGLLHWQDLAVAPALDASVEGLNIKLGPLAWPLDKAAPFEASARWAPTQLTLQGEVGPEALDAKLQLSEVLLERFMPYLPLPQGTRASAGLGATLALRIAKPLEPQAEQRVALALSDLLVTNTRLQLPGQTQPALSLAKLGLDQARLDPAQHAVELGALSLEGLKLQLRRDDSGQIDLLRLAPPPQPASAPGPAWSLKLAALSLAQGGLRWQDVAGAAFAVEPLQLQLQGLSWPASAPVAAKLKLQLAGLDAKGRPLSATAGRLEWQGQAQLAPLAAAGKLKAERLPLQLFDAYLDPAWRLHLARAELGINGDFDARQASSGWQVSASGDAQLAALSLQQAFRADGQTQIGDDLLSWQSLKLDGLKLTMVPGAPLQLGANEARLDDFFARLVISEQGRFNLRDVGPAEPASAASAPAIASTPPPQIRLARTVVNRGAVDFTDHFIRPNYSARLSDLSGSLGAFASGNTAMAPLTLRGKVAGTGLLEIDGQLNPSGAPLAMDVRAHATDIELAPLSPYAAKYAGYAVERGKLSTHMTYRIEPGGKLEASNQIILNQLTFGDKVDSPDATTLPVRFAVALLKDRNGVIDVNLPVSGSLNDPEFSVGGIVWKLILNLIGKALTAPFSLFSGGDATEEAKVRFAPGHAVPSGTEALDKLAKLLVERPGVQVTITGQADRAGETEALRALRLDARLLAEKRREDAAAVQLSDADRERLLKRLYQTAKLANKPKNLLGLAKDLPPADMRALLLASDSVDDEMVRQLALSRGIAVRDALIERGAPNARIFLAAPKLCEQACEPLADLVLAAH